MLMLSDKSYAFHFSRCHRWFVSWSYPFLGSHLTEICMQAIFDFSPLIRGKREGEFFFFFSICYKLGTELYILSFSFHYDPLRIWSQFHRWGNWGLKRLNNLPEDTQTAIRETGLEMLIQLHSLYFFLDIKLHDLPSIHTSFLVILERRPQIAITQTYNEEFIMLKNYRDWTCNLSEGNGHLNMIPFLLQ